MKEDEKVKFTKKSFIIIFALIFLIVLAFFTLYLSNLNKAEKFEKYKMNISLNLINKSDEEINISHGLKCDKKALLVHSSSLTNNRVYIKKTGSTFNVIYKEDNMYKVFNTTYSPENLYEILSSYNNIKKVYKNDTMTQYSVNYSSTNISKIFKNMYLDVEVLNDIEATMITENNMITSVNFNIDNVGDYKNINLNISFEELESDYEILVPSMNKNTRENIDKNILSLN